MKGLSHAHKDHIADATIFLDQQLVRLRHLVNDFAGNKVGHRTQVSGGAKLATHSTPHLTADTNCRPPSRGPQNDRFHQLPRRGPKQQTCRAISPRINPRDQFETIQGDRLTERDTIRREQFLVGLRL